MVAFTHDDMWYIDCVCVCCCVGCVRDGALARKNEGLQMALHSNVIILSGAPTSDRCFERYRAYELF